MNSVYLNGQICNIQYSHTINNTDYSKAQLYVHEDNITNIINLRFKTSCFTGDENDVIAVCGNLRSYSKQIPDQKNKVSIYVFTYFNEADLQDKQNVVMIDGRVCKIDNVYTTANGSKNVHLILANNIYIPSSGQKLNSYIPVVLWNELAKQAQTLSVNSQIKIIGKIHSRTYKKLNEENTYDTITAHEVVATSLEIIS